MSSKFWPFRPSITPPNSVINTIQQRFSPKHGHNNINVNNTGNNKTYLSELFKSRDSTDSTATTQSIHIELQCPELHHNNTITAALTTNNTINHGIYKFYRCQSKSTNKQFDEIQSSALNQYVTSIDDIDCIIICQYKTSLSRGNVYVQSNMSHCGPIQCQPGILSTFNEYKSNTTHQYNITVNDLNHQNRMLLLQINRVNLTLNISTMKSDEVDSTYSFKQDNIVFTVDSVDHTSFVLSCNKSTYYLQCDTIKTRDLAGLYIRYLINKNKIKPIINQDLLDVIIDVNANCIISISVQLHTAKSADILSSVPITPTSTPVRQTSNVAQPVLKRVVSTPTPNDASIAQSVPSSTPSTPVSSAATINDKLLQSQINDLKAEKQLISDERNQLYEQIAQLDIDYKQRADVLSNEIDTLQSQLQSMNKKLQQTIDERNNSWNDMNDLKKQLQHNSMIQADNANREIELANKLRSITDDRHNLTLQQNQLRDERTQYTTTIDRLSNSNTELNNQVNQLNQQLQQSNNTITQQSEHIKQLQSDIDKYSHQTELYQKKQSDAEAILRQQLQRQKLEMEKQQQYVRRIDELELQSYQFQRIIEQYQLNANTGSHSSNHVQQQQQIADTTPDLINLTIDVHVTADSSSCNDDSTQHSKRLSNSVSFNDMLQQLQQHAAQHNHILIENDRHKQLVDRSDMYNKLQISYNELEKIHSNTVQQLHQLRSQSSTAAPTFHPTIPAINELQSQLNELQLRYDEMTTNRNFYKSKHTSLSHTVDSLTRQLNALQSQLNTNTNTIKSPVSSPVRASSVSAQSIHEKQLLKELKQCKRELNDAQTALDYYKQAFDEQNTQLRSIQQDRLMLQRNSLWQGGVSSLVNTVNEGSVSVHQFDSVKQLCSTLTETVAEQQRTINELQAKIEIIQHS